MVAFTTSHNDETIKSSSVILDRDYYPDPRSLPKPPSLQETIPSVTLSELESGKYISIQARIIYLKTVEKHDALGEKLIFSGLGRRFYVQGTVRLYSTKNPTN